MRNTTHISLGNIILVYPVVDPNELHRCYPESFMQRHHNMSAFASSESSSWSHGSPWGRAEAPVCVVIFWAFQNGVLVCTSSARIPGVLSVLVWMVSRSVGLLMFWLISTWMQKVGWEGWTLVGVFLINIITQRERIGEPHVFLLVILTWYYVFREQLPVLHSLATWLGTPFLYWLGPPLAFRTALTL